MYSKFDLPTRKCPRCRSSIDNSPELWCGSCVRSSPTEYLAQLEMDVPNRLSDYLTAMGVPANFRDCTFGTFKPRSPELDQTLNNVRRWARNPSSQGLFLSGDIGVGKTHLAVAAMGMMRARSCKGKFLFVRVSDLTQKFRQSFSVGNQSASDLIDELCSKELLVLDDFGASKISEFGTDTMFSLIDRLYGEASTALIGTSNLNLRQVGMTYGNRTADRLSAMCLQVRASGQSYRQEIAEQAMRRFRQMVN